MAPRECEAAYRVGCLKNAIRGSSLASTRHTKTVVPALSRAPQALAVARKSSNSVFQRQRHGLWVPAQGRDDICGETSRTLVFARNDLSAADQRAKAEDKHLRRPILHCNKLKIPPAKKGQWQFGRLLCIGPLEQRVRGRAAPRFQKISREETCVNWYWLLRRSRHWRWQGRSRRSRRSSSSSATWWLRTRRRALPPKSSRNSRKNTPTARSRSKSIRTRRSTRTRKI